MEFNLKRKLKIKEWFDENLYRLTPLIVIFVSLAAAALLLFFCNQSMKERTKSMVSFIKENNKPPVVYEERLIREYDLIKVEGEYHISFNSGSEEKVLDVWFFDPVGFE